MEGARINITKQNDKLETSDSEIVQLTKQLTQHELEATAFRKEVNSIADERDQLLIISSRKDGTIEHLRSEVKMLEGQLTSAISTKCDALARLTAVEGKEQSLDYRENRMEKEKELMKSEIESLTDNLNRTMAELLALRQENTSATVQIEIELKRKTDELRVSNATICQLTETNQLLKNQCEENALKFKEQVNESVRLMDHYQKDIDAKTKLADLYKENSDDHQSQINELNAAVKELKGMLNESADEFGVLETKLKGIEEKHQIELSAKRDVIAKLKQELKIANELLKTDEIENAETNLENLIPLNVAANRRLHSGLTLTEIYSRYYKVIEELQGMELDTVAIISELHEKAPEFDNLCMEYKKVKAVNDELTQKIDNYIAEKFLIRKELQDTRSKFEYLERENEKLKSVQTDLARQVCYLLHEINSSEGVMRSDQIQSISADMPANEVICKRDICTFKNIVEMQENNQKLLLLVRNLSIKSHELEDIQKNNDVETYEVKIAGYGRKIDDLEQLWRTYEDLLANSLMETERFKRLYHEIMKDFCDKTSADVNTVNSEHMNYKKDADFDKSGIAKPIAPNSNKDKNIVEMEFQEKIKELKDVKEEYIEYRNEKSKESKMLNEKIDALSNEILQLTATNLKVSNKANYTNEQIKTQQNNVAIYKKQIKTLEERNQMHEKTISKHEITTKYLKDEASNIMKKLSAAESRNEHLQRECRRLVDINRSLEVEHQSLNREKLSSSILQSNLEMIKGSFERLDNEGRLRTEQRLDDTVRECSALRRRLQEEQDHFRAEINAMKLQKGNAEKKMLDEQSIAETLRAKLIKAEEQTEVKNQEINELTRKIQQSLVSSHIDNPIDDANNKIKELEQQSKNQIEGIEKLNKQIIATAERESALRQMASAWEDEARKLQENFDLNKTKMTADLEATRLNETKLKTQVEELKTEIRLEHMDANTRAIEAACERNVEAELKEAILKLGERDRELRDLRSESNTLTINLNTIDNKYSNEMQVHSSDLQALTICKDELNKCQEQIGQLRIAKDVVNQSLEASRLEYEKLKNVAAEERMELEQKLECMDQQNTALYDQLHAQHDKALAKNNSFNDSFVNSSILSQTLTEDEVKENTSDELLKVIKFLRKEKDMSVTKAEIIKTENTRLLNKLQLQGKRVSELNLQYTVAQPTANTENIKSAAKYDDLMSKVATLNAITEGNIHLREERDALISKVKDLTDRVTKLEDELFPIQDKIQVLSIQNKKKIQECIMLRTNLEHWKKRASYLVEQNRENLKDFKRFQNERENLTKMLTSEKENLRKVIEELNSIKSEKMRFDVDVVVAPNKKLHTIFGKRSETQNELNNIKQMNAQVYQEIIAPFSPHRGRKRRHDDDSPTDVEKFLESKIFSEQSLDESYNTYEVPDYIVEVGESNNSSNQFFMGELLSTTSQAFITESRHGARVTGDVQPNTGNRPKTSSERQVKEDRERNDVSIQESSDVALSQSRRSKKATLNQFCTTSNQDAGNNHQSTSQQHKRMRRENSQIPRVRRHRF